MKLQKFLAATVFVFSFALVPNIFAKEIHYPISSLGNCRDKQECFYFCEIPKNQVKCKLYQTNNTSVLGETTTSTSKYTFPIAALGNCASYAECSAFCNKTENHSTCLAFSESNRPSPATSPTSRQSTLTKDQVIQAAKEFLGCDYATTCHDFCNQTVNQAKCKEFSQYMQSKMSGQTTSPKTSPPPISSTEPANIDCSNPANASRCQNYGIMCGNFCQKNPQLCKPGTLPHPSVSPAPINTSLQRIMNATGCKTAQECSTYCKDHQDICRNAYAPISPHLDSTAK